VSDQSIPLSIQDLTFAWHRRPVIWDVEFDVSPGRLVGIVGPNGAGKSTLLKAVMDLVPKASGRVEIFGRPWRESRQRVGYVPQRESVDWDFPVSVLDVVTMGLYGRIGWFGRVRRGHREAARRALEQVGIGELADRQISQLSGGQQQRTFLARALVQEADLYLLDEPFAAVDDFLRMKLQDSLRALHDARGLTTILVTHNLQEAAYLSDRVVVLQPSPRGLSADLSVRRSRLSPAERRRAPEQFEFLQQLSAALFPS